MTTPSPSREKWEDEFDSQFNYLPPKDGNPLYMVNEDVVDKEMLNKLSSGYVEVASIGEIKRIDNLDVREELKAFIRQLRKATLKEALDEVKSLQEILWHDNIPEHTRRIHRQNTLDEVCRAIKSLIEGV